MEQILEIDRELFLILNGTRCQIMDLIMIMFSARLLWIPLYLLIVYAFFYSVTRRPESSLLKPSYKIERIAIRKSLFYLFGALLLFAMTDFGSNQIKYAVERLRPCYDPCIKHIVVMLENRGKLYGFTSNHATNVFGLAIFSSLVIKSKRYSCFILLWATLVSYSRIYVGKHFPLDIIAGALLGGILGWIFYISIIYLIKITSRKPT